MARVAAGAFGFLTLIQVFDGPVGRVEFLSDSFKAELTNRLKHLPAVALGVLHVLNAATGTLKHFAQDSFSEYLLRCASKYQRRGLLLLHH
jgi:hypothetical protein